MLTDQHLFRPEGIVSDAKGQVPLQTSAQFVRTYSAQAHEITNAITAVVLNADAVLQVQSPDLVQIRRVLNSIANDGKRAGEIVVRTRALIEKVAAADAAL